MASTIPQSNTTQKFQKTMGGSIKSLFSPGTRTYFMLEHKSKTDKHNLGETANFMTDYVEIGRGSNYAVNFGDDCKTVSRPHAAIVRKQDDWMLTPISKTNPTLVNGHAITKDTLLRNGDEIQLSAAGPKFSFLIPANPKVSGLNFTVRLKAAMNEAIRPYKKTIMLLSLVFILLIGGLSYIAVSQNFKLNNVIAEAQRVNEVFADSLKSFNASNEAIQQQLKKIKVNNYQRVEQKPPVAGNNAAPSDDNEAVPATIESLFPHVYFIQTDRIVYEIDGKTTEVEAKISGTGFLLNDGSFVTARHVIEPWLFSQEDFWASLNLISNNGGSVVHYFTAFSPDGSKLTFTSKDFKLDNSNDESKSVNIKGNDFIVTIPSLRDGFDWAVSKTSTGKGLLFDKSLSNTLPVSTELQILGYSFGIGVNSGSDIRPTYNTCKVSRSGLDKGVIDISDRNFDSGNSGGPVFMKNSKGQFIVVGIVSAGREQQGFIVPISSIQ
ncbi:MAG: FHA domain-containing protein [Ferruginibacter sp.]